MFNERLLRAKMAYNGKNLGELASDIGIDRTTLTRRLKDGSFNRLEISKITEVLQLSDNDVIDIFFAENYE